MICCNDDVFGYPTRPLIRPGLLVVLLSVTLLSCGVFSTSVPQPQSAGSNGSPETAAQTIAEAASSPPAQALALVSANQSKSDAGVFLIVSGQVRNVSATPLRGVSVRMNWLAKDGTVVTSTDASLQSTLITPGETSTFTTIVNSDPLMERYQMEFSELGGETVAWRDERASNDGGIENELR